MEQLLFTKDDLGSSLQATSRKVIEKLESWDHDALLNASEADVVEQLIDLGTVRCPRLLRDQAWMPPPTETRQTFNQFGRAIERKVTRLVLVLPFEGEQNVFLMRANTFGFNPPRVLSLDSEKLRIALDGPGDDASQIRSYFNQEIDRIDEYLGWSRKQIEQHNGQIQAEVPQMVSRRRASLLATRNLQAQIGFPMHRRTDADTYSVPIKRRTLRSLGTSRPTAATTPFRPEPALADGDYQAALAVLRNSRNALERTPSLAAKLDEEQIRDLLLVNLNAHFEGDAAGEVFNGAGKTDILIRVDDRNIFIGECKVWSGPNTMDQAMRQLFTYLVWRDTKAAILLFIRNKDVSAVISKAIAKIEEHPNFKRRGETHSPDNLTFVVHADGDPDREIQLALLPFALRTSAST